MTVGQGKRIVTFAEIGWQLGVIGTVERFDWSFHPITNIRRYRCVAYPRRCDRDQMRGLQSTDQKPRDEAIAEGPVSAMGEKLLSAFRRLADAPSVEDVAASPQNAPVD